MSVRILEGDALTVLGTLPDQSVQCCVTSPPYFGLRDYGSCSCGSGRFDMGQGEGTGGNLNYRAAKGFDPDCKQCNGSGRVKGTDAQLGLEKTPQLYVDAMVGVFREVRRVLRDDATLWLNLGDSYAANGISGLAIKGESSTLVGTANHAHTAQRKVVPLGLKPKDLLGIPWMVAFALRADGWYLRSDIIWHKPNPMPESITDRPTKAHEYLFLLAKNERYFYDADAIAEDSLNAGETVRTNGNDGMDAGYDGHRTRDAFRRGVLVGATRNRRTVWTIPSHPYSEAHFATFPPKLIEPCILAGSAKGQTILDPFGGAGTTGLVADRLGRDALLIELNPKYAEMARQRIHSDNPLFGDVA